MSQQASHLWKPIEDLPPGAESLARPETTALVAAWKEYAHSLENRNGYHRFLTRLRREWAIETGVLERLYSCGEGATKTLIEKGFDEALISHGDTDRPAREVIAIIKDQAPCYWPGRAYTSSFLEIARWALHLYQRTAPRLD